MKPASHSKRLFITGITGFTGKFLAEHFSAQGYDVFGTVISDSKDPNHFKCDLRDREAIKSVIENVQPTHILHMAAISFVGEANASMIYDVNVIGTCNLLDALLVMKDVPKKVILASSATVYGDQGCEVLDESMCPKPVNHYGCSKYAMEQMASNYRSRLPLIITRPFNYTGPGQESHFLIPKIVSHYREGKKEIELGNLHVEREFNDIHDVCAMYSMLLESDAAAETVNLCSGRGIALLDVIKMMDEIAGYKIEVSVNPAFVRPNEIKRLVGCSERVATLIGHREPIPFRDTLQSMYRTP
ncbi:MAG: GDP-mannose 4,6-dehydratase [Campylobacterales bacterium]|nr:GDP-mannose 4,6-dehydratase [Campylobacterales bacterium]